MASPGYRQLVRCAAGTALAAAGLTAASVASPAAGASAAAPSLTGEFFGAGSTSGDGGTLVTTGTCSQTSSSTITFTAAGTVPAGPYPGSFTESGVVTVSATPPAPPQYVDGVPLYQVAAIDAFFTITSAAGTVSGVQHLSEPGAVWAACDTYTGQQFGNLNDTVTGTFRELSLASDGYGESYDALITTPGGSFEDTGTSGLLINDLNLTAQSGPDTAQNSNTLNAAFTSTGLTPVSGAGNVTGGGQINPGGSPVSVGFEANSDNQLKGQCDVVDQAAGIKIHCSSVTGWAQLSPTEVEFSGAATINGTATSYLIDVTGITDPGTGASTFTISTSAGYTASGTLIRGDIQIHTP